MCLIFKKVDFVFINSFSINLSFSNFRTDNMVDVISTRLQEVYGSWRIPGIPGNIPEERLSANALRRFGESKLRRKYQAKDSEQKVICCCWFFQYFQFNNFNFFELF